MDVKKIISVFLLVASIIFSGMLLPPGAHAERHRPAVDYGAYCRARGGEVHKHLGIKEAIAAMRQYFQRRGLEVNNITHGSRFIRADLIDTSGNVIDSVLLDSWTGRLRSVY